MGEPAPELLSAPADQGGPGSVWERFGGERAARHPPPTVPVAGRRAPEGSNPPRALPEFPEVKGAGRRPLRSQSKVQATTHSPPMPNPDAQPATMVMAGRAASTGARKLPEREGEGAAGSGPCRGLPSKEDPGRGNRWPPSEAALSRLSCSLLTHACIMLFGGRGQDRAGTNRGPGHSIQAEGGPGRPAPLRRWASATALGPHDLGAGEPQGQPGETQLTSRLTSRRQAHRDTAAMRRKQLTTSPLCRRRCAPGCCTRRAGTSDASAFALKYPYSSQVLHTTTH